MIYFIYHQIERQEVNNFRKTTSGTVLFRSGNSHYSISDYIMTGDCCQCCNLRFDNRSFSFKD